MNNLNNIQKSIDTLNEKLDKHNDEINAKFDAVLSLLEDLSSVLTFENDDEDDDTIEVSFTPDFDEELPPDLYSAEDIFGED